jgi:ribokinase
MIVVAGSINVDLVVRVPHHAAPGETVLGSDYQRHPGGKGANQAVAAARLGVPVRMVGRVGRDAFGDDMRASLQADGVDVSQVRAVDAPTGVAFIQVDAAGQNVIVVSPGANARLRPGDAGSISFNDVDVLLLQLEVPLETVKAAARAARVAGVLVVLNAAPARELSADDLRDVSLLVVNEHEAAGLLGRDPAAVTGDPVAAARALRSLVPLVVVTLGGDGAAWADEEGGGTQPAFSVDVVDTTAAGDAFVGAIAGRLVQGDGLGGAVRYACAAGAVAATRPGAQPSLPTAGEVATLLARALP